ncbi:TPA: collagenase-like protease [Candidatus Gastranaerophilales bacterium HUM_3]|nr:MAG TPA: collagenase-like protease [Candidatus Gastranaerophilales bacterium HUM_3]DAB21804.1 MAG TPA: collagenase-like protease [Candidatus Gastranaerophilales bacterium HUM_22]
MKTELLSPAKDKETAFAAIDCGADAVYMGAAAFGARKNAPNSLDDIRDVVNYAHKFRVKVFITLNTILTDSELDEAVTLAGELDKIGVDALIVQDMGLLEKIKTIGIPVHISTQADNRDLEKVSFFNNLGAARVVLARELSLKQIKEIHDANPNLELEAFVHGALCVSYSGQCYLSQYIGGRSANRGECAQPCRKKYSVETVDGKIIAKDIYALCLKDFNASNRLKDMIDAGVYSFKIEGRLKDSNYVKNITAYYRHELDKYSQKSSSGRSIYPFKPNPEKSFNRGFTDYFLEKRKDCFSLNSPKSRGEYIGVISEVKNGCIKICTDKTIHPQDGLTDGIDGFLVNKIENNYVYPNRQVKFKAGDKIYRNVDVEFEKQVAQKVKRQIGVNINITDVITLVDEDGIKVSIPITGGEAAKNPEKMKETFVKQFSKTGESDFYIEDIKIASELPFMPVSRINELRRSAFDKLMQKRLDEYKREEHKNLVYCPYYKSQIDYRGNVHNLSAKDFYKKCGAEVCEMSLETELPKHPVELMRTKHCIKYALGMCKSPEKLVLRDEYGKVYPLKFDCKKCEMSVLNNL